MSSIRWFGQWTYRPLLLEDQSRSRMEIRPLGTTALRISVVGLGGVELRGGDVSHGEPTLADATAAVEAGLEGGINWLDTAEAYYRRRNETFIGEVLREIGDELLVATKLSPSPDGTGFRHHEVRAGCRASLDRLGRERIDIYFLHYPDDTGVPLDETWGALAELVDEGLVRAIGLSNYPIEDVERCHAQRPVDVVQDGLSLVDHLDNRALIRRCGELGIGVVVYEPLGSGTLSGRSIEEVREVWSDWSEFGFYKRLLAGTNGEKSASLVDAVRVIAERQGVSVPQLAIAWVLHQEGVTAAIAGSRNPQHVRQNALAGEFALPTNVLGELERVIPIGPTFAATT
jgi:aryl-alcohol dehydrogenase-like predicted oxidoreductase